MGDPKTRDPGVAQRAERYFSGWKRRSLSEVKVGEAPALRGRKVLLVDKPRAWEPQSICDALSRDPRIHLYPVWLRGDRPAAGAADLFRFDQQQYDVILEVNRTRVADGDALKAALDRTPAGKPALVLIERKGETRYLTLERPAA